MNKIIFLALAVALLVGDEVQAKYYPPIDNRICDIFPLKGGPKDITSDMELSATPLDLSGLSDELADAFAKITDPIIQKLLLEFPGNLTTTTDNFVTPPTINSTTTDPMGFQGNETTTESNVTTPTINSTTTDPMITPPTANLSTSGPPTPGIPIPIPGIGLPVPTTGPPSLQRFRPKFRPKFPPQRCPAVNLFIRRWSGCLVIFPFRLRTVRCPRRRCFRRPFRRFRPFNSRGICRVTSWRRVRLIVLFCRRRFPRIRFLRNKRIPRGCGCRGC